MLTLKTILKAMRQKNSYGETPRGALDHLPSRLVGYRDEVATDELAASNTREGSEFVRKWSDEKGAYIYEWI